MFGYNVLKIIEDVNLKKATGNYIDEKIQRSWKERLFTLPWTPWRKFRIIKVAEYVPDTNFYLMENNTVICHPAMVTKLKDYIRGNEWPTPAY